MSPEKLADKLRKQAEARHELPPQPTAEELDGRVRRLEAAKATYAETRVPIFIDILTQKAEAASAEDKRRAFIVQTVDIEIRPLLRHTMDVVAEHFVAEGFETHVDDHTNYRPMPNQTGVEPHSSIPSTPATEYTAAVHISW